MSDPKRLTCDKLGYFWPVPKLAKLMFITVNDTVLEV